MSRENKAAAVRRLLMFFLIAVLANCTGFAAGGYQLIGRIVLKDREVSPRIPPLVLLEGAKIPFTAHTRADRSGKFKFKNLQPDMFTLIVYISRAGEYRRTVEVSPGLADDQKRIYVEVEFQPNLGSIALRKTSVDALSIPEKAIREYEKAHNRLGSRDSEGSIAHLKKTVELAPQFVEAWNTLGTLAYKSAQYQLAEKYFREALSHDPEYYPSVVNLGGALLTQGRLQDALPHNLSAVNTRPDDALAHSQLGLNHYYLGQLAEAEEHLKIAISLDPGHFSYPQIPLAEIYARRKDFQAAAREIDQFLSLHPDSTQSPPVKRRIDRIRSEINLDGPQ